MSDLDALVTGGTVQRDVDLSSMTTYKVGGSARWFAQPSDVATLETVAGAWRSSGEPPLFVLGRGSNVVVSDRGFPGLVVKLGTGFGAIDMDGDLVRAGGAVSLPVLARAAVASGRRGLEWYVGIPGTVGGAVHQNAGCHGSETIDVLMDSLVVSFATATVEIRPVEDLGLRYRHSDLGPSDIVARATFHTSPGDPAAGEGIMREVTRWRKANQPGGTLNAGSVFKNPPDDAAGRLVEKAGLKGLSVGGARVSERHANFIEADRRATASDIRALVREVRRRVRDVSGVDLEPEIAFVGPFD